MNKENYGVKKVAEFGKASMYVIAGNGLHNEPATHRNALEINNKAFLPEKGLTISRSKEIDFNWKEIAEAHKLKIVDLNGSVRVDAVNLKRDRETRCPYAGAFARKEYLNKLSLRLNKPGVNILRQTQNQDDKNNSGLASICSIAVGEFTENGIILDPRKSRREIHEAHENFVHSTERLGRKKTLPPCDTLSTNLLQKEKAKDNSTILTVREEGDDSANSASSKSLHSVVIFRRKAESLGKHHLKRLFYSKVNDQAKPSSDKSLPQIQGKATRKGNSDEETKDENNPDHQQKNQKFLVPLNVNVSQNHKKDKRGLLPIIRLPTVVNRKTGQVHLALEAVAYEKSDYNRWSRRENRITHENSKSASRFKFP